MTEEYIKEFENMNLYDFADELVEPLSTVKQDLTKTIYIHYAKERDENYKLQNNWNELKVFLKEIKNRQEHILSNYDTNYDLGILAMTEETISKMQELEQGKDE